MGFMFKRLFALLCLPSLALASGIYNPGSGSGSGGGSSSMQTTESGVEITSPTSSQNFLGLDFDLTAVGSTATIAIATVNGATHTWTAPQTMKSSFTVNHTVGVTNATGQSFGIQSTVTGNTGTPTNGYAIFGQVNGGLADSGYGVKGVCTGNNTSCYGGHFIGTGGVNNYGVYIASGQLFVASSMTVTGSTGAFITYGLSAGSVTARNLASGQCVQTTTGGELTVTGSACSAGGSSFVLAVTTGSPSGFLGPAISSPTQVVIVDSNVFTYSLLPTATGYLGLNTSSVTLQGNTNVDLLNSTQTITAQKIFNTLDVSSFTYGVAATTITLQNSKTGGGAITFRNAGGTNAQINFQNDTGGAMGNIGLVNSTRFRFVNDLNGPTVFQTNDVDRFRIKYAGDLETLFPLTASSSFTINSNVLMGAPAAEVTISSNLITAGATFYQNGLIKTHLTASRCVETDSAGNLGVAGGVCGTSGGYATIQDEGSGLTQRATVNFIGSGISCVDNGGSTKTDCTISGSASSLTIATGAPAGFNGPATAGIDTVIFDSTSFKMQPISATTSYVTLSTFTISSFTWAGPFVYTVPTNPVPLVLDVWMCAGAGSGGGGNGQAAGSARGGGTGAGGGSCRAFAIDVSTLGATFGINVGTGAPGGAGGTNNSGTSGTAGGVSSIFFVGGTTLAIVHPGGFGFGNDNGDRSGGGGGGWCGVGVNGGSAATAGGCPTAAASTNVNGFGGGGAGSGLATAGATSDCGGAGGGAGRATTGGQPGGASSCGGGGGGGAGGCTTLNVCGSATNGGGNFSLTISSGGGLGGTSGATCTDGSAGVNGGWMRAGAGGGAGGSDTDTAGCNGGNGGYCGGGGGGGGAGTNTGGTGGKGGTGCVFIFPRRS